MATEKKGGAGIRYDDFVKIVKPDPGSTEQVVLLHGYVGASVTDDKIRLYSDASLMEYADIAKADVVYSLPNNDDPLGGSRLWVKQGANLNYADAQGYAQGDMYNSYMNDQYSPGAEAMGHAASLVCTIAPLTRNPVCRPTRFICPTPVSRLVICTLPPRTRLGCPLPTLAGCPQPSWVDACPSQWGCTIQTGTTVINPGTGGAQFGADYTGGDMYNDYMQNSYEGGGEGEGFAGVSTPLICVRPTLLANCPSVRIICASSPAICRPSLRISDCFSRRRTWCPPVTCQFRTMRPTWPSLACATDITRTQTIQTGTTIINPGTGGAQFGADYAGGDVYNDYMENSYEGAGTEAFGPVAATSPQICLQPVTVNFNCASRFVLCQSRFTFCISQPIWRCITRQQQRSICRPCIPVTLTRTNTFPSAVDGCPSQLGCATDFTRTINPDTINPGGFGGYNDYGY